MVFKDLINDLKKIKTAKDLDFETTDHLTSAAIGALMSSLINNEEDLDEMQAFEMTRALILKKLDAHLMSIANEDFFDDDEIDEDSFMNDPELNKAIEGAIKEYNNKMNKKQTKVVKLK